MKNGPAIDVLENLLEQKRLLDVYKLSKGSSPEVVRDFYDLIESQKSLRAEEELNGFGVQVEDFFRKHFGIEAYDPNVTYEIDDVDLENEHLQTLLYFHAYVRSKFNINSDGKYALKISPIQEQWNNESANKILEKITKLKFSPAFSLMAANQIDEVHKRKTYWEGAKADNHECSALLAQDYLSHLMGNMQIPNPAPYLFPEGCNEKTLLDKLMLARDAGNVKAIGFIGAFIGNFMTSAPSLFQQADPANPDLKVLDESQKERLRALASIAVNISGDTNINAEINKLIALESNGKKSEENLIEAKRIRDSIDLDRYGENSKAKQRSVFEVRAALAQARSELEGKPSPRTVFERIIRFFNRTQSKTEKALVELDAAISKLKRGPLSKEDLSEIERNSALRRGLDKNAFRTLVSRVNHSSLVIERPTVVTVVPPLVPTTEDSPKVGPPIITSKRYPRSLLDPSIKQINELFKPIRDIAKDPKNVNMDQQTLEQSRMHDSIVDAIKMISGSIDDKSKIEKYLEREFQRAPNGEYGNFIRSITSDALGVELSSKHTGPSHKPS